MPTKKRAKTAKKKAVSLDRGDEEEADMRLPVTLLCGFLGAGKTTLLKHILEVKNEKSFKCAVIVNDMAALNIDSALVESTTVVENKKVIAMQNGCVCCSLADDLSSQVVNLALEGTYSYVIIEASGVSEPSEIAKLFVTNNEEGCDHDHADLHAEVATKHIEEMVRLDTCVTVLDAGQFFQNLEELKSRERAENIPRLLVEQIEYSNVVIINKMDLLDASQLQMVQGYVSALNSHAEIVTTSNSVVDVNQCLFTNKYKKERFETLNFPVSESKEEEVVEKQKSCCANSVAAGKAACCSSKSAKRTFDSGLSSVELADSNGAEKTRHSQRFGIKSFVYKARRPFHFERFKSDFVNEYFVLAERAPPAEEEGEGNDDGEGEKGHSDFYSDDIIMRTTSAVEGLEGDEGTETLAYEELRAHFYHLVNGYRELEQTLKEKTDILKGLDDEDISHDEDDEQENKDQEQNMAIDERDDSEVSSVQKQQQKGDSEVTSVQKQQEVAMMKQNNRKHEFGNVIRAKGFCWMANSHDLRWAMSSAGNVITMDVTGKWNALDKRAYASGDAMSREWAKLRADFQGQYADRRQELVFIGIDMDHYRVQEILDNCLLTDDEMEFGVDGWKVLYSEE